MGQGYSFTGVCHSVNRGVWSRRVSAPGGVSARGGCLLPGGGGLLPGGGGLVEMATAVGGKHPTGMHSCFS